MRVTLPHRMRAQDAQSLLDPVELAEVDMLRLFLIAALDARGVAPLRRLAARKRTRSRFTCLHHRFELVDARHVRQRERDGATVIRVRARRHVAPHRSAACAPSRYDV